MEPISLEEVVSLISEQPASEFVETLKNDNGEWKAKEEIKTALNEAYSNRLKKVVEEQKGRAVRERMTQAERFLKEKYGVESGDTLETRIEKLVESVQAKGGKEKIVEKTVELTEENALKNPVVEKLLKREVQERLAQAEKEANEWKAKYQEFISKTERERLDGAIQTEAANVLNGIKAALDKDPERRDKQIKMFLAGLKAVHKFKVDENGKPYPVNANGEPLEDEKTFSRITFADLVKRENIFGVHDFDPDKGSPGATSQTATSTSRSAPVPTDAAEFYKALKAEPDKLKRDAMMKAFEEKQKAQAGR